MDKAAGTGQALRFGVFELDLAAGELRKSGLKVHLQEQPLQLLAALLERPSEVVSREELKDRLWPSDTYVDFDRSLNTAASKLRDALGDSASSPRFVETLPRRGYRFVAPVETVGALVSDENASPRKVSDQDQTRERALRGRLRLAWFVAGLASVVALGAVVTHFLPADTQGPASPLRKFTLALPGFAGVGNTFPTAAISPNGEYITYASAADRKLAVWEVGLDQHRMLEGTERAMMPFWSPDSESIGFWAEDGEIKRVSVDGGPVTTVAKASGCALATWSPDGESIVFNHNRRLFAVSARGGHPHQVFPPKESEGLAGEGLVSPHFLPSAGRRLVVFGSGERLMLLDLDSGGVEDLADVAGVRPLNRMDYSPSGHLVYGDARNTIWAVPFSLSRMQATGDAFAIAESGVQPSIAADQTLVYEDVSRRSARFIWVNRRGEKIAEIGQPYEAMGKYFSLAPDDRFVAERNSGRTWVHEVDHPNRSVLPFPEQAEGPPIWSSSGAEILFSTVSTAHGLYIGAADGSQQAKRIYDSEGFEFASDWSRDGTYIFYDLDGRDVWYLERNAEGDFEPKPFLTSGFAEKAARISPDNRWVAYVSDESGTVEVYVRRFPQGDSRTKVSRNGGRGVRWGRDGRRIYYTVGQSLFEVDVRFDPAPVIGTPQKLFELPGIADVADVSSYSSFDVSADGERFVVQEPLPEIQSRLTIVQNWYEGFRHRKRD